MPRASRGYFSDFPQIEYQAKIARSIMARPRIASSLLSNPAAIYSYTVNNARTRVVTSSSIIMI